MSGFGGRLGEVENRFAQTEHLEIRPGTARIGRRRVRMEELALVISRPGPLRSLAGPHKARERLFGIGGDDARAGAGFGRIVLDTFRVFR